MHLPKLWYALLFSGLLTSASSPAGDEPPPGITVSGTCTQSVVPDRGTLTVTADFISPDAKQASQQANRQYETIRDRIKRLSLADFDLSTTEAGVEEIKEWEKNRMVSRGFRARMGLRVMTSDFKRLGEVLDLAAKEGVKDIGRLSSQVSPARLLEAQGQCLKDAAANAKEKARKLSESLGRSLGAAVSIQESTGESGPRPFPMAAMSARSASLEAAPPTIEAGKVDVSATVTVRFELK